MMTHFLGTSDPTRLWDTKNDPESVRNDSSFIHYLFSETPRRLVQGAYGIESERARRPKRCNLAQNRRLRRIVARKLSLDWSPEQISGWLKRVYPDDESLQVSHETIYRSLLSRREVC